TGKGCRRRAAGSEGSSHAAHQAPEISGLQLARGAFRRQRANQIALPSPCHPERSGPIFSSAQSRDLSASYLCLGPGALSSSCECRSWVSLLCELRAPISVISV